MVRWLLLMLALVSCPLPASAQVRRVAVMDFINTAKDPAMEWLGPSVAETVTTKLHAIRGLQLVERAQLTRCSRSRSCPSPISSTRRRLSRSGSSWAPSKSSSARTRASAAQQGRYAEALSHYDRSLNLMRRLGDEPGQGRTLNNIGVIHERRDRYLEALSHHARSLKLREQLGDQPGRRRPSITSATFICGKAAMRRRSTITSAASSSRRRSEMSPVSRTR